MLCCYSLPMVCVMHHEVVRGPPSPKGFSKAKHDVVATAETCLNDVIIEIRSTS